MRGMRSRIGAVGVRFVFLEEGRKRTVGGSRANEVFGFERPGRGEKDAEEQEEGEDGVEKAGDEEAAAVGLGWW